MHDMSSPFAQVSLERPAAPAPGLPADLSSGLSAQPRYDVSSSFSYTGPIDSFGYSYTGSSSGVSYSDNVRLPLFLHFIKESPVEVSSRALSLSYPPYLLRLEEPSKGFLLLAMSAP
jgi:hypothetical protein